VDPLPGATFRAGDVIVVLGATRPEFGGSAWATHHGLRDGTPPEADLDAGFRLHRLVAALVGERVPGGVHDCSDGGLAIALAEMAINGEVGFEVEIGAAAGCFSESASRVVLGLDPARVDAVVERARAAGVPAAIVGTATGDRLVATGAFDVSCADATRAYRDALPEIMSAARV
jgi:phosphoribosylformylglycinamidine synthase subunit PurL